MSKIKSTFLPLRFNGRFTRVSHFNINSEKGRVGIVRRISIGLMRRKFGIITAEMSAEHIIHQIESGVK
jgi:hypothetical protein